MRAIVWKYPPEFPSDNPELWKPRVPVASVELLIAEAMAASEAEAEAETEAETEADSEADSEAETEAESE